MGGTGRRARVLQVLRRTRPGGDREVAYQILRRADPGRFVFEAAGEDDGPYFTRFAEAAERVHRVPFDHAGPLNLRVVREVRRIVRGRVDLIHCHGLPVGSTAAVMLGAGRTPVVLTNHGPSDDYRCGLKAKLAPLAERAVYRRAAAVTFVSPAMLGEAKESGLVPARARAVVNGVDLDWYRRRVGGREEARAGLGLPDGAFVVGCVGRMHRQKDPGLFVRVAARLRASHPEMRFVWIGASDPQVLEAARRLGLGEGFLATGHNDRVPELLPAFDVFLLTSRWEGLPLVLVEAQAAGVPVVASAVNGVVDVVRDGETGLLFPKGDEGAAATAVERLLGDPGLREKLASRATAEIGRFDLRRMVRGYEEVYEDVLRRA